MSHARWVIMSRGADGALGYDGTQLVHEPARPVTITDRIGAGDALAAGVLHGWLAADSRDSGALRTALRYGVTLAALALSQYGDAVITTHDELESLAGAEGGDIVR
jgi:2-dehydro-3-deoxygluconokinase